MEGLLSTGPNPSSLATLYNKILATGAATSSWGESLIKLIHKKGPTNNPSNFRPIALSNTIAKAFHLILAKRTTDHLTRNGFIDPTVQKAFSTWNFRMHRA